MDKTCACGAPISLRATRCKRCRIRLAQARYDRSEKGRAKQARYLASEKGRAVIARYKQSEKGKAANARYGKTSRPRRIFVGRIYGGSAQTIEQATAINAHVKERLREFIARQQAGAEAEGASSCAVSAETEP